MPNTVKIRYHEGTNLTICPFMESYLNSVAPTLGIVFLGRMCGPGTIDDLVDLSAGDLRDVEDCAHRVDGENRTRKQNDLK